MKDGYWASDAGGKTTRFGKVAEVPHADAMRRLNEHLASIRAVDGSSANVLPAISVNELSERFLAWVLQHRGTVAHRCRSCHLKRFREAYGDALATDINGTHVEAFIATLRRANHAPDYIHKHIISVGAMFNKGVHKGWLPSGVRPLARVEPIRRPAKMLAESSLPTDAEVKALFAAADADPFQQMGGLLRLYHATGARTHEIVNAKVGDFQLNVRTIVLGNHKRSHTMREPVPRTITLNAQAFAIVAKRSEGRPADAPIFSRPKSGKPMARFDANQYFRTVRDRAGVRSSITIYSFRHLWISEMLMAGVDVLLVARMAGTSVKMIETVYGHFRTQSYQDAQVRLDAQRERRGLG